MQYPWAITEDALVALAEVLNVRLAAGVEAAATTKVERDYKHKPSGNVGVIPIRGTVKQHQSNDIWSMFFETATTEGISATFHEFMADDSIRSIVFDIDSPGGTIYGVDELANEIMRARGTKPIIAVANSMAASAAYWIGATADQFYASPGALVGSIGVYMLHHDLSGMAEKEGVKPTYVSAGKYKVEGNQFEPLTDEARSHLQAIVDDGYSLMVKDIAHGRGVPEETVRSKYGEGRVLTAKQAKAAGMVDGVMTLNEAITRSVRVKANPAGVAPKAEADIEAEAQAEGLRVWRLEQFRHEQALGATAMGGR